VSDAGKVKGDSGESGKTGGLLQSTAVVGSMTLLSRILGLARDMVYARFFGAGLIMDAFFVAFKIPNIFRRFFAEGAFSQAFVPVFAEYDESRSKADAQVLANNVAGTLGIILFAFTAIGVIAAPVLISLFGMGWLFSDAPDNADKFALATDMLRFTFPYLFFISLTALAGGILNTYKKFAAPAFAPVLLNVVLIGFAAYVAPYSSNPGIILAMGVFLAGLLQLLFMVPFLRGVNMLGRPRWAWHDPGVRRIAKLMLPALFGSSVAQISILFDTMIATFLVTGSVSWLYFSDRLMEFPLGIFGIALATVVLPSLSRQYSGASMEGFSHTLDWALRLVAVVATPAAVGLFMLAGPAIATIFYGRLFDTHAVEMARMSLMAYAFGLVGFTLVKVLVPGYFARQDMKTPVKVGLVAFAANLLLNVILVMIWLRNDLPGPHTALAAATAISAFLNAFLLYKGLIKVGVLQLQPGWSRLLLQLLVANAVLAMLLFEFAPALDAWYAVSSLTRVAWLGLAVVGGATVYLGVLFATGMRKAHLRIKSAGHSL
jgi:putative peptidoglycan lipid II flippase